MNVLVPLFKRPRALLLRDQIGIFSAAYLFQFWGFHDQLANVVGLCVSDYSFVINYHCLAPAIHGWVYLNIPIDFDGDSFQCNV